MGRPKRPKVSVELLVIEVKLNDFALYFVATNPYMGDPDPTCKYKKVPGHALDPYRSYDSGRLRDSIEPKKILTLE